ncbi:hypothetical protein BD779DRAFT_1446161 [Infundibulicybe gibba]|nr:hypothetical protein BD779DRAFT_1446161 [Infundibulicybe gibba]
MSNIFSDLKSKATRRKSASASKNTNDNTNQGEPAFSIQPHPAKSNDPADLNPPQAGGGLRRGHAEEAFHARDPYIPSQEIQDSLEQPLSREELKAQSAQLNG